MPYALATKVLEEVEKNPKIHILHTHTGTKAFQIGTHMFKGDEEWEAQFSASQKSKAFGFLYSKLLIKNKIIIYTLIIGDSVLGERFSYEKGYTLYNESVDKN